MSVVKHGLISALWLWSASAIAMSVYQVDTRLYFAQQLMTTASYVILEGDSSQYEQRGEGGYRLALQVEENQDASYTIHSTIQSDNGKELITLGTPSIQVLPQQAGWIELDTEAVGVVKLQVTLVRHEEVEDGALNECEYVECQ